MVGIIFMAFLVIGYVLILNSKMQNKGALLLEKIITALLSALLYSLFIAYLSHTSVHVGYFSFGVYFIYTLPVFLLCGGLSSFFADIYLNKVQFRKLFLKYIAGLLAYLVGGLFIVGLFTLILLISIGGLNETFIFEVLKISALPALLFHHISLFYKGLLKMSSRKI